MKRRTFLGAAITGIGVSLISKAGADQPPIKIGLSMAQTGGLAGGGKARIARPSKSGATTSTPRAACSAARSSSLSTTTSRAPPRRRRSIRSCSTSTRSICLFAPYGTVPTAPIMPLVKQRGMVLIGNFSFQVNSKVHHDMWFNNAPWGPADSWASAFFDIGQKAGGKTVALLTADQEFAQNLATTAREVAGQAQRADRVRPGLSAEYG